MIQRLASGNIYGFNGSIPLRWHGVAEYLDRLSEARPAVNVLTLVPNGQLRLSALGIERSRRRSRRGWQRCGGCCARDWSRAHSAIPPGWNTPPEIGATEEEITCLCRDVARYGALYATHTRNRDAGSVDAVAEALRTGAAAEVRLQVSHLIPRSGEDDGRRVVELVESARAHGQDVAFDMHTRLYGTTFLASLLPPWAREGSGRDIADRLRNGETRVAIKQFRSILSASGDWERVVLLDNPLFPDLCAPQPGGDRPAARAGSARCGARSAGGGRR